VLNEAFGTSADELAQSRRVIEAYAAAAATGRGALMLDGRMVDLPVVERAERALARGKA
jgi:citrate lyase subunit beta/citryl-CoA lyase